MDTILLETTRRFGECVDTTRKAVSVRSRIGQFFVGQGRATRLEYTTHLGETVIFQLIEDESAEVSR